MNLQETVSKLLNKDVSIEEAKDFALDQFGVLTAYIKSQQNKNGYYQIVDISDEGTKMVGVIKVVNGQFPMEEIEEAISSHLGADIHSIDVNHIEGTGSFKITFKHADDGFKGSMFAEETWLYTSN